MYEEHTVIGQIQLINPMMSYDTNDYLIKSFDVIHNMAKTDVFSKPEHIEINNTDISNTNSTRFGIKIRFERNSKGIIRILVNYHLMCAILVLVASINFLIDPNVVPGRAGLLVTLFLVLTKFFSDAQVPYMYSINFEKI